MLMNRTMPWMRIYRSPADAPPSGAPATPAAPAAPAAPADPAAPVFPTLKAPAADPNTPPAVDPAAPPAVDPAAVPYAEYVGPPSEGKYADFTPVEGQTIDKGLVDKFAPIAAELGLSQKGAQKLADFYAKEIVGQQSAAFVEQISTWFDETSKDKEIGGDKFTASTLNAEKALKVFGTGGLRQLMVQYGIGNHPEVVRFFARVGGAIGEDSAAGGKPGSGAPAVDFLTKMYGPPVTK